MSATVSSGIRSWAGVVPARTGWASTGSHRSGFHVALRRGELGQCEQISSTPATSVPGRRLSRGGQPRQQFRTGGGDGSA
ncbi:hypothetical protein [Streptomyces sp. NPDC092903]|uniref:hypothetical protein n=1 Tax=Streptomyces sp. NPDC092903 TaxID=3366017 RepID=UPI0037F4DD80